MKILTDRATMLSALSRCAAVAPGGSIPILGNVLITAAAGQVTIAATDMELAVSVTSPATVGRAGTCTVTAAALLEIVRKLPDGGAVQIEHAGGDDLMSLTAARYKTKMVTLPVEDFPAMVAGNLPHRFAVPGATLRALIDSVSFAISTEETRYYLNGIFLHAMPGSLRATATDGHRLALADAPLPDGAAGMPGVIVPRRAVAEIRKLVDHDNGDVTVELSGTRLRITSGVATLTTKLIDGSFPEYERVIPRQNENLLRVKKADLAAAAQRVAALGEGRESAVRLGLGEAGALEVSCSSPERGSAVETIDAEHQGKPDAIGFKARYLADVLGRCGADVEIKLGEDGACPALIADPDNRAALFVLMPIRV